MKSAPLRFWPSALLILLPVIGLAVLAAYGLDAHRRTLLAEASDQAEALAQLTAEMMQQQINEAGESARPLMLYSAWPGPGHPHPREAELERAAASGDLTSLIVLRYDASAVVTATGIPVRVLAAWEAARLEQSLDSAEITADIAIHEAPSIISGSLLERLADAWQYGPAGSEAAARWLSEWKATESKRRAFQKAVDGGLLPEKAAPPGDSKAGLRLIQFPGSPASEMILAGWGKDGRARIVTDAESLTAAVAEKATRAFFGDRPSWVSCRISAGNADTELPDSEKLAAAGGFAFRVAITRADEGILLRPHYRLVWWAVALIAVALLSAVLGLVLTRRALVRERRLGDLKSQFVSSVSHELRAPLGSMRLMAEALAAGKISGPAAAEFHRLMASEGARLSALIENVLDFARIEQGRRSYTPASTDAAALVSDAVKLMAPRAEAAGQTITTNLQPLPRVPEIDAGAVFQALINLMDNALKFSPAGAEITVDMGTTAARNQWSLSVTDRGPGVPEAERGRIFERFYRLGNELRRETIGAGIGLAIVKHIADAHGAKIRVESPPGGGSRFTLEFSYPSASGPETMTDEPEGAIRSGIS